MSIHFWQQHDSKYCPRKYYSKSFYLQALQQLYLVKQMREPLSSLLESYTSGIKQQTLTIASEVPFGDKFVQIMERVQSDSMITKDLVLELMQLFYKNNQLFLQLFETSFLLIFKTYANEGARFNKYESQPIIDKYSQLLKLFLIQMIKMQLEVRKSTQEQQYFENFVDFYLTFFAQGLMSSKSFIKEFSFKVLRVSLKIIDDVLDVELLRETEGQLVESCLYLLGSGFDDYKMMGVELYGILRRIKIASIQVQEFLFGIIESHINYELRKAAILQGLSLRTSLQVDRLLNRLRDKNPLIKETAIQKLINENTLLQGLEYEQRMKILIDGVGSHHVNVRHKAIQFVGVTLAKFLHNQKVMESKEGEIQVSGIERFLRLFNSDHLYRKNQSNLRKNQPIFSLILESVSLMCLNIPPQLVKVEIKSIVQKTTDLTITNKESAFIHSFLREISTQRQNKDEQYVKANKLVLRKFITLADFLPSFPIVLSKIRKALRQEKSWGDMGKFGNILKSIELLIKKFDVTDCSSKKQFHEQVRKFIIQFEYQNVDEKEEFDQKPDHMQLLQLELIKLNRVLSGDNIKRSQALPLIAHPFDLVSLGVGILLNLSQQNSLNDSILELKMHITQLLNSKQLELQRDITTKMLNSTCIDISKSQKGCQETKQIQHLLEIKRQLQKRLLHIKLKSHANTIKAFTILAITLSYQQSHYHLIKASQFLVHIKNYLYNHQNENSHCYHNQGCYYIYLPYMLIYYYCKQSQQNYNSFKKLFHYYALEQDKSVLGQNTKSMLTKLINLRLLTQLEIHSQIEFKLVDNSNQTVTFLVQKLISMVICSDSEAQDVSQLQSLYYRELFVKIFSNSITCLRNNQVFTKLMLLSLFSHFHHRIQIYQLWIRQILITLQRLSISHQLPIFQSLLISYQCLIRYLYRSTQDPTAKSKVNAFISEVSRIFLSFFKVTTNHSTEHFQQQNQHNKILFQRLVKMVKMLQILLEKSQSFEVSFIFRLKTVFPCLYHPIDCKQFHLKSISIQQLIFIKNKLQRLLELYKAKEQLQNFQKSNSYLLFISDIDQLNDKVEDEISKRIGEKSHLFEHQQSTSHSPNQDNRTNQKINFSMIQTFEENFNKEAKQQLLEIKSIIDKIRKTYLFQNVFLIWEKSYSQKQQNINAANPEIIDADKIDLHSSEVINENPQLVASHISELFDRRGRRKNKTLSKKMNVEFFEAKASVKKNRYLIIPYEMVQKAESSSKKIKNHQNTLKRQKNTCQKLYLFTNSSKTEKSLKI